MVVRLTERGEFASRFRKMERRMPYGEGYLLIPGRAP
jgi:hypothetical protein